MTALLEPFRHWTMAGVTIIACAAALTATLILWLRPWLLRYAMARPNARSSHTAPTPQGGGIAVIAAFLVVASASLAATGFWAADMIAGMTTVFAAMTLLAVLGAVDDIRPIEVIPRLLVQGVAVAVVIATLPADFQMTPFLPWWTERILLVFAGLWFVNLVNFMDGLDWMTVAVVCALALLGALIGFAPFNRPVARLFLGDVGSLPLGLLAGWLLALLADKGHLAAAILLPLYYLMDATVTLLRRLARGERFWQAHRSHFYQRATDNGFAVSQVISHVFGVNIALTGLAALCVRVNNPAVEITALVVGVSIVGWLLMRFSRKQT